MYRYILWSIFLPWLLPYFFNGGISFLFLIGPYRAKRQNCIQNFSETNPKMHGSARSHTVQCIRLYQNIPSIPFSSQLINTTTEMAYSTYFFDDFSALYRSVWHRFKYGSVIYSICNTVESLISGQSCDSICTVAPHWSSGLLNRIEWQKHSRNRLTWLSRY